MRCQLCPRIIKNRHESTRKTKDELCHECLMLTERIIYFDHFALIANQKEIPSYLSSYNKMPHWICKKCGVHNHETRVKCLGCNEDSDYH